MTFLWTTYNIISIKLCQLLWSQLEKSIWITWHMKQCLHDHRLFLIIDLQLYLMCPVRGQESIIARRRFIQRWIYTTMNITNNTMIVGGTEYIYFSNQQVTFFLESLNTYSAFGSIQILSDSNSVKKSAQDIQNSPSLASEKSFMRSKNSNLGSRY